MKNAGLTSYFEESISVEIVPRFKPDLKCTMRRRATLGVRELTPAHCGARMGRIWCHESSMCRPLSFARNGIFIVSVGPKPDIIGSDLRAVTARILG